MALISYAVGFVFVFPYAKILGFHETTDLVTTNTLNCSNSFWKFLLEI